MKKTDFVKGVLPWLVVGVLAITVPIIVKSSAIGMNKIDYDSRPKFTPTPTEITTGYVINTSSKKIHTPDCSLIKRMKEENKGQATEKEIGSLLDIGYTFCGTCGQKCMQNTQ